MTDRQHKLVLSLLEKTATGATQWETTGGENQFRLRLKTGDILWNRWTGNYIFKILDEVGELIDIIEIKEGVAPLGLYSDVNRAFQSLPRQQAENEVKLNNILNELQALH
jgi:hypothetical protein